MHHGYHGLVSGGVFHYLNPPLIHWGARSLDKLAQELDGLSVRRPYVVTTKSVAGNRHIMSRLEKAAERDLVGEPGLIGQHAPYRDVEAAVEAGKNATPDAI